MSLICCIIVKHSLLHERLILCKCFCWGKYFSVCCYILIGEECNAIYLSNSTVDFEPHCAGTADFCVQYSSESQWTDHESVRRDSSLTQASQCIYNRVSSDRWIFTPALDVCFTASIKFINHNVQEWQQCIRWSVCACLCGLWGHTFV